MERPLIPALQPRGLAGLRPGAACLAVLAHPVCHRILRPETRSEELAMYVQHPPPRTPSQHLENRLACPGAAARGNLMSCILHWPTGAVMMLLFICLFAPMVSVCAP